MGNVDMNILYAHTDRLPGINDNRKKENKTDMRLQVAFSYFLYYICDFVYHIVLYRIYTIKRGHLWRRLLMLTSIFCRHTNLSQKPRCACPFLGESTCMLEPERFELHHREHLDMLCLTGPCGPPSRHHAGALGLCVLFVCVCGGGGSLGHPPNTIWVPLGWGGRIIRARTKVSGCASHVRHV
jgi:hypothetical protein